MGQAAFDGAAFFHNYLYPTADIRMRQELKHITDIFALTSALLFGTIARL
jgi:hypothetical protein